MRADGDGGIELSLSNAAGRWAAARKAGGVGGGEAALRIAAAARAIAAGRVGSEP